MPTPEKNKRLDLNWPPIERELSQQQLIMKEMALAYQRKEPIPPAPSRQRRDLVTI